MTTAPVYEVTTTNAKGEQVTHRYACRCAHDCDQGWAWIARAPMAHCFPDGACACECHAFGRACKDIGDRACERGEFLRW